MKIKGKTYYAGLFIDKYFLILEDGAQIQLPFKDWESYNVGDIFQDMDLTKE